MSRFPLFSTGQQGRSVHVNVQRRLNLFCQIDKQGDRSQLTYHSRPGLTLFASMGETPVRGALAFGSLLYLVHRGTLWSVNNAGVKANLGSVNTTSGRVDMATNGVELMIVDGTNGYIYEMDAPSYTGEITDASFPDTVNTVDYLAGRFIYDTDSTGQFGVSASYDGTTYDGTEVATAEAFPDDIQRVFTDHGEVILFGSKSTEFWANVGALDFPYQPIPGAVVEYGLAARWSVAKLANTVAFLAKNREGQVSVVTMAGYQPTPISNPDLEYVINKYSTLTDASAYAYQSSGHSFYQLNFPTAQKSWLFDNTTRLWSELEYGAVGARHRAEFGVEFLAEPMVFDYENGNMYRVGADTYTDNGEPVSRELIGRHIIDEETVSISRLWLDVEAGQDNDPQAMLSVSKDGGHTWGDERWTGLGAIGEFTTRAIWRVLGQAYDWVMRIRITSSGKVTISGAWVDAK